MIVLWQPIPAVLFSLPLAVTCWGPLSPLQRLGLLACGLLGSAGR